MPTALIRCRTRFEISTIFARTFTTMSSGLICPALPTDPGPSLQTAHLADSAISSVCCLVAVKKVDWQRYYLTMYSTDATCLQFGRCSFRECSASECLNSSSRDHTWALAHRHSSQYRVRRVEPLTFTSADCAFATYDKPSLPSMEHMKRTIDAR